MKVRVLLFGILKDIYCREGDEFEICEGATVADIVERYRKETPQHHRLFPILAFSVNQEYAQLSRQLRDGDEVAMLPPVSGGAPEPQAIEHIAILFEPIDATQFVRKIQQGSDGAVCIFQGIVRNHSKGRRTIFLDYEAYEPMALLEMRQLREQALRDFKIRDAAIVHRLGRLEIGETSVLVVVVSAHREAAFAACQWLIDTLKKRVPIWKKEHFEDGAIWADGEPFPGEIKRPETASEACARASTRK